MMQAVANLRALRYCLLIASIMQFFNACQTRLQQDRAAIHDKNNGIKKLWLTASGGPFLHHSFEQMQGASVAEAVKHPNWSMGQKSRWTVPL